MAKVLFFNLPAYGHMNPTLPLVAELVQRGEHVIYYSSEAFRPAIDQIFIAKRVQQLGAGKILHNTKLNVQRLRKAAEEILAQPTFQQRSANIGASLRQAGGPSLAVDKIEAFKLKHGI